MIKLFALISSCFVSMTNLQAQEISGTEEIYTTMETMPEPLGGISEFYKFISKNIKFPKTVIEDTTFKNCKVFIKFVIEKDGALVSPKVLKGCKDFLECDLEGLRVIEMAPKWKPGMMKNEPVKVYYTIPIGFKLK